MIRILVIFLLFVNGAAIAQTDSLSNGNNGYGKLIHFIPEHFYNAFSLNVQPVLEIHSGDTVMTETIDAMGFDKDGKKRQKGGNPLTGPFFIKNATTGDRLAIQLIKVTLNRDYAFTTETIIPRGMPGYSDGKKTKIKLIRWKLDRVKGFANPDTNYEHLQNFKVPLRPFMGCIGVAPDSKNNEHLSFFQGNFGGNLDCNALREGSTLYLPVLHDGAYLYFGDGHALQGDGELAGNALETSMDISFTVRVIKQPIRQLDNPRAEDSTRMMSIGIGKNLDKALQNATTDLVNWLQEDWHLSKEESAAVVSTSMKYEIAQIADPEVAVVATISKSILAGLTITH